MIDLLFEQIFQFELDEKESDATWDELLLRYSHIPVSILKCELERIKYKYELPSESDISLQHLQNTVGWEDQRKGFLTSSTIGSIVPSTDAISKAYRTSISKSKRVEKLSDPKSVLGVRKRIAKYVIEKIDNTGIGNNIYLRWGKRFENVAKHVLQQYIGMEHPILDVNLQRHLTEACLATSLDGDIPSLNAIAEFKCIYYTTKFYENIDWNYYEQLQSQLDATGRETGYWLMCQFDSYTMGSKPHLSPNGLEEWKAHILTLGPSVGNKSSMIQNGIFLKEISRYESYMYPPMHLQSVEEFWEWMKSTMAAYPARTYYPVFWNLKQHNLLVLKRDHGWLDERKSVMRAVMRMVHYYRAEENATEYAAFRIAAGCKP